jgi:hypothetical protein
MDSKPFYASKTMWGNLIAGGLAFLASHSPWVRANLTPEAQIQATALAFAGINLILRLATKSAVTLWVALLFLVPLQGCAKMADFYNAHGFPVTLTTPFINLTLAPRVNPEKPAAVELGHDPAMPAPVAAAPGPGGKIATR